MATTATTPSIPHIHLMIINDEELNAINTLLEQSPLPESVKITIHSCPLSGLPQSVHFDLIVSPANSYGRMDGGFDHFLSKTFSPQGDYLALTRLVQGVLYREWKGFAPPGTCTLVDLHDSSESLKREGVWDCRYLAVCPTMRVPQNVKFDREVVYECMWTLLGSIDKHNDKFSLKSDAEGHKAIESILMTPLATLTGHWSPERWAAQVVLAIRHFVDAQTHPEKWTAMDPISIMKLAKEVAETHKM